jgi:hypothetical protein
MMVIERLKREQADSGDRTRVRLLATARNPKQHDQASCTCGLGERLAWLAVEPQPER